MSDSESKPLDSVYMSSPLKAIRKHCLSCSGDAPTFVRECTFLDCDLYPFRMGKNPARKGRGGRGNPEALRKWREQKETKK